MKVFADLRRWIGGALSWLYPVDMTEDPLSSIQIEAINRNRQASEENRVAARDAGSAITDLLAEMEARKYGKN